MIQNKFYIASFTSIVGRSILGQIFAAHHRQGVSLPTDRKTRIDFEKTVVWIDFERVCQFLSALHKNRQVSQEACRFFYPSRRLGMESCVSVYGIAVGVCHYLRYIFCGLIPYRFGNGFHTMLCIDSIHAFGVIWYESSCPYRNS